MPTECAHATCRNVNTNKALSFHRFPKSKERLDRWTYLMRRHEGWKPKRWDLVCSAHFLETDFDRTGQTTRLREGVEPSVFDVPRHLRRKINERSTSNSKRQKLAVTEPVAESIEEASTSESSGLLISWHSYAAPNENTFKDKWFQAESRAERLERKLSNALKREHRSKTVSLSLLEELRKNLLTDELQLKLNAFKDFPIQLFKTSSTWYSEEQRRFALTLHLYGPKAYEYWAKKIPLPSTRNLRRWLSHADGSAGISEPIIAALGQKVKEQPAAYQNAALIIDAMSVRKQIVYDSREKRMTGFVDLGDGGESEDEASEVLVFMVVGLCGHWKAPVAHYLTRGLQAGTQKQLLLHCLRALHEVGIRVWTVTMDGHATNVAMCKELGCKLSVDDCSPTFPHPDDPTNSVAIIFDPCHMLKLFRNLLDAYGCIRSATGRVDWNCIKALNSVQDQAGLRLGNRLSQRHISFHRQKMKVNLAAQALSNSVAKSLQYLQEVGHPDFTETSATVEFLQTVDHLFDVLNSRNTVARGYKSAIRHRNWLTISTFLQSAKTYLTSLKTLEGMPLSQSKRHTAVTGLVIAITSLQQVVPRLLETQGFILTYKFSLDHLELFFNAVRRAGGRNDNPNVQQFQSTFRKLVAHSGAVTGTTGNIVKLDDTNTLAYSTLSADVQTTIDEEHDPFTGGGMQLNEGRSRRQSEQQGMSGVWQDCWEQRERQKV
ncbi:hypothetical protein GJAV_G00144120 [Gymnothorax javanicus]|nr:hypothetical protein GJAV_G00144120 [Gymnothorax javanicus]